MNDYRRLDRTSTVFLSHYPNGSIFSTPLGPLALARTDPDIVGFRASGVKAYRDVARLDKTAFVLNCSAAWAQLPMPLGIKHGAYRGLDRTRLQVVARNGGRLVLTDTTGTRSEWVPGVAINIDSLRILNPVEPYDLRTDTARRRELRALCRAYVDAVALRCRLGVLTTLGLQLRQRPDRGVYPNWTDPIVLDKLYTEVKSGVPSMEMLRGVVQWRASYQGDSVYTYADTWAPIVLTQLLAGLQSELYARHGVYKGELNAKPYK